MESFGLWAMGKQCDRFACFVSGSRASETLRLSVKMQLDPSWNTESISYFNRRSWLTL